MKLTTHEIAEYILVALIGIVGFLAYFDTTANVSSLVGAEEAAPIVVKVGGTKRADVGLSAVRFREVALAHQRV